MKVLYIATRWPWPIEMGRQRMICQTLTFASEFAEVHLLSFADAESPGGPLPAHISSARKVQMSGLPDIARSVLLRPGLPLQSHLFLNGKVRSALLDTVAEIQPDVVIFDMARLYSLARLVKDRFPKIRLVLDMDDRLSERYQRMMKNKVNGGLGGTFTARLPVPVRAVASLLPKLLLTIERHLVARIERRAHGLFDSILMVSPLEAEKFNREFLGSKAIGFPPLIEVRQVAPADFSGGIRFVFVGNAVYGPNAEALTLLDRIAARVKAGAGEGAVPFSFAAAGKPDPGLALTHIEVAGFVPDLGAFLSKDAVLVAPILNGTGIKTKIIDALEYAVPVVTTPLGAEGLSLQPGLHFHQAKDEQDFAELLLRLVQSAQARQTLETMAREAREVVLETHSRRFLQARLRIATGSSAAA